MMDKRRIRRQNEKSDSAVIFHLLFPVGLILAAGLVTVILYTIIVIGRPGEPLQDENQAPLFVFGNAANESAATLQGGEIATVAFPNPILVAGSVTPAVVLVNGGLMLAFSTKSSRFPLIEQFHNISSLPPTSNGVVFSVSPRPPEEEVPDASSLFTEPTPFHTATTAAGERHPKTVAMYMSLRSDPRELQKASELINDVREHDGTSGGAPFRSRCLLVATWISARSGDVFQVAIASNIGEHQEQESWAVLSSSQTPDSRAGSANVIQRIDKLCELRRFIYGQRRHCGRNQYCWDVSLFPAQYGDDDSSFPYGVSSRSKRISRKGWKRRQTWKLSDRHNQQQLDHNRDQLLQHLDRGQTTQRLDSLQLQATKAGVSCHDNATATFRMFKPNSRRIRTCEWLERRRRRQSKKRRQDGAFDAEEEVVAFHCSRHEIRLKCPLTCGVCKSCNDRPDAIFFAYPSKKNVNCTFVAQRRRRRRWVCDMEDQPGYALCPQTCRRINATCEETTSSPTSYPTTFPTNGIEEPNGDGNEIDGERLFPIDRSQSPTMRSSLFVAVPASRPPVFPTAAPTWKKVQDPSPQSATQSSTKSPITAKSMVPLSNPTGQPSSQPMTKAPTNNPTVSTRPTSVPHMPSTRPTRPSMPEAPTPDPTMIVTAPTIVPPTCFTVAPTTAEELTDSLTDKILEAAEHGDDLQALDDTNTTPAPTTRCILLLQSPTIKPKTPINPTAIPTTAPITPPSTALPSMIPTMTPSSKPTLLRIAPPPTVSPKSLNPSSSQTRPPPPTILPSTSTFPSSVPSTLTPTFFPTSRFPTILPTSKMPIPVPTHLPTAVPLHLPSAIPSTIQTSSFPSLSPSMQSPTLVLTELPSASPFQALSETPSFVPSSTEISSTSPSHLEPERFIPTSSPSEAPSESFVPTQFKPRSLPFEFGIKIESDVANNNGTEPFVIPSGINFLGGVYHRLFQNVHGHITFRNASNESNPILLPSPRAKTQVAAFWTAIADPSKSEEDNKKRKPKNRRNQLFVGLRNDTQTLQVAQAIIAQASSFPSTSLTINSRPSVPIDNVWVATWSRVSQFNASSAQTNTFQASLAFSSLGTTTWVILSYEEMEWARLGNLENPGTIVGLNGRGVSAGGATIANMEFPGDVQRLQQGSNINFPGTWVYRVDR